jgi:membrane-associated phospholipid phosphatase
VIASTRVGSFERYRALAAIFALIFVTLVVIVATGRPALDLADAQWIADHRREAFIPIAEALSLTGSVAGLIPLGVLAAVLLWRRDGWPPVGWLVLANAGASILYLIVNLAMASTRPPMPLRVVDSIGWSFPSGHSTQAAVFWPMLAVLSGVRYALAPAIGMVCLIGASRLCLDVHWTTDVASGYALGLAWLFTVLAVRARRASVRA